MKWCIGFGVATVLDVITTVYVLSLDGVELALWMNLPLWALVTAKSCGIALVTLWYIRTKRTAVPQLMFGATALIVAWNSSWVVLHKVVS